MLTPSASRRRAPAAAIALRLAWGGLVAACADGATAPARGDPLRYVNPGPALAAAVRVVTPSPVAKQAVTFDASGSVSPAPMTAFAWDWGDGTAPVTRAAPAGATHAYAAPGTYTVTVAVTDSTGATGTASVAVAVGATTLAGVDAGFTVTPAAPVTDSVVVFAPAGGVVTGPNRPTYAWTLPDGTTDTAAVARRTWAAPMSGTVTLRVQVPGAPARTERRALAVVRAARFVYHAGDNLAALGATFTRAGTATYVDSLGVLRTAAANVARDAHYVNGVRTLLIEGASTNQVTNSEQFTQGTGWAKNGTTVTPAAAPSPTGAATATFLREDTTTSSKQLFRQFLPPDGTLVTVSIFAKAASRSTMTLQTLKRDNSGRNTVFDLVTCAVTSAADTADVGRTTPLADGWCRLAVTFNVRAGGTPPGMSFLLANNSDGNFFYKGDGASGAYIWGAQVEYGQSPASSYVPTTTVAVTRPTDALAFPWPAPPQAMTVYADALVARGPSVVQAWAIGAATYPQFSSYWVGAGHYLVATSASGTSLAVTASSGAVSAVTRVETRAALGANFAATAGYAVAGGTEATVAPTAPAALPSAWGNSRLTVFPSAAHAWRALVVQPYMRSMAEMRAY